MKIQPQWMENVALVGEAAVRVRDLLGFRRGHQVPAETSPAAVAFVARIASRDLEQELDEKFAEFRRGFGFRRTELQVTDPENGIAQIVTPWFDYQASVTLNSDNPAQALWRRQLTGFRQPDQLNSHEFAAVFGQTFDTVEFEPAAVIDLEQLVDHLEDRAESGVTIDYDRQLTWCDVSIAEIPARLRVQPGQLSLKSDQPELPTRLLQAFFAFRQRLTELPAFENPDTGEQGM